MAQLVISAAGAAVGFYVGGPVGAQVGWTAGAMLGSRLVRPKTDGTRLSDLKVSGSAYGVPIPYVEGHPRVPMQIIWASDKYAVTSGGGGKGGPSPAIENAIYKVDLLGLLTANEIAGVRRIWSNGELVWTAADDASGDSLAASAVTDRWDSITVYGGGASQLPDPTYEAAVGSGNAPAYRGRGTVAIAGLNLGSSGVLPNLTFEVTRDGAEVMSAILDAPLTADKEDTVSPTATATAAHPSGISYSATGAVLDGTVDSANTSITYTHAGGKLSCLLPAYDGERLTLECDVRIHATGGADTDQFRFLSYNTGSQEAAFSFSRPGGVSTIYTWYYSGGGLSESHGAAAADANYKIEFAADGETINWYIDDVLVRTVNAGGRWTGDIYIQSIYHGGLGVKAIEFKDLRFYAGELVPTYTAASESLEDVVVRQCERAGLDSGDVDASALSALSVRSLAVAQPGPPRVVLDLLASAYAFECVESGGQIKAVLRGGSSAATIAYASMGASAGAEPREPLPLALLNDIETAAQVTVRYVNVSDDYQDGAESSDRLLGPSRALQVVEVPLGLTPAEAKVLADVQVMDVAASQRTFGPVALSNDYAHLEPTDVVTLTDSDGSTWRGRILTMRSAGGVHTIEGVVEDASILTSTAATSTDGYTDSSVVAGAVDTTMVLLDIPILRDEDDGPGFYAAFKGASSPWPGCALYASADGVTYSQIDTVADATQIGTCTTTLGAWAGGTVFDETNSVTVDIGSQTLSSWSRDDILAGTATGYVVGDELIYARTATLVSPGVYTLTGLLRGRRGTEWAMASHASSERFVALPASGHGLRRVVLSTSDIGVTRYYKAVTSGRALSTATEQTLACASVGQKPFAPVDLRAAVSDSAVEVTWKRRTRYATRFTGAGGISVPLGETSEAYTVELRDSGDALVSTETVTESAWANGSAAVVLTLAAPTRNIASIGGELVGIFDDEQYNSANPPAFERLTADTGTQIARSPTIGSQVYQWAADGDNLYAATADISYASTPAFYTAGRVLRYDRADLSAAAATYTAATAGDPAGVAHDGTDVWITERYGDNLRKLNASTLVSAATYPLGDELGALVHDAGTLWICSPNTDEVIEWDIGTTSEISRVSVAYRPLDVLVTSTRLWVLSATELAVYNKASGALVAVADVNPLSTYAGKTLCEFNGDVACIDVRTGGQVVTLLDASTGAVLRAIDPADPYLHAISAVGTTLYITTSTATHVVQAAAYELAAPGLSGYSLTVAQQGAIGDGYTATLDL